MTRFLHILAHVLSALFYPLWIPTYGMVLFCCAVSRSCELTGQFWFTMLGGTFLLTALLPGLLILMEVWLGQVDDIYIVKREQRTTAYIEAIMGFAAWWYVLQHVLGVLLWLAGIALGGTIAIVLVLIINHWWKISAHLTGMGGLVGGLFTYQLATQQTCLPLLLTVLGITLLVMYARLYLRAHTSLQVIAGFGLGMLCTVLIPLLMYAL